MGESVLRKGSRLGKYRLDRRLGQGAFADVWKARDTVESRHVALKIVHAEAVDRWGREEIEHEARIAARLEHPNIVGVRNADWVGDRFLLAADLARTSLEHYPAARRSGSVALRVIRDVVAALAHAHARRVLHRDVKPDNILIFDGGRAALCDFGLSRFAPAVSATFTRAGTLGYLAPEQAYGRVRFASDVFSLALIAYEILTGVLPTWPFEWPLDRYARFRDRVPEPVRPVLRKAMRLDPRRRYPDAVALQRALDAAFSKVEAAPKRRAQRQRQRRRRKAPPPSPLVVQSAAFRRAHGKGLELHYRCHRCEGPIAEAMSYCPWCGADDNSFREVTRSALVCPECERGVRPEWNFCPWCFKGRFEGNGRKPPPDRRAVRPCAGKGCPGLLRPFMSYCPMCKRKTRRVWSHPDLPDRCPRCRWPTSHTFLRFCPWCGRREARAGSFVNRTRAR